MLAWERHARILDELDRRGSVKVSDLVALLRVSDMTVRRDLESLSRRGLLEKVYGGATQKERAAAGAVFGVTAANHRAELGAIAALAAQLVSPGSAVAVSSGGATHALARHLARIPELTVVTNSLSVAEQLRSGDSSYVTVQLTGGMRTSSDALTGPVASQVLRSLHVDTVFLSVHGMHPTTGFTTMSLLESETNRAMIASGRRLVVLAESRLWGVVGLSTVAPLSDASVVVSDTGLPSDARDLLSDQVARLLLAESAVDQAAQTVQA